MRSSGERSSPVPSPIDSQVSVTTQSAPETASLGSMVTVMSPPSEAAQSSTPAGGRRGSGQARRRVKPNLTAASIQDAATLLPSPLQATTLPAIGPRRSSKVMMSAINWHGWLRSDSPLMTGTVACCTISSRCATLTVRSKMMST